MEVTPRRSTDRTARAMRGSESTCHCAGCQFQVGTRGIIITMGTRTGGSNMCWFRNVSMEFTNSCRKPCMQMIQMGRNLKMYRSQGFMCLIFSFAVALHPKRNAKSRKWQTNVKSGWLLLIDGSWDEIQVCERWLSLAISTGTPLSAEERWEPKLLHHINMFLHVPPWAQALSAATSAQRNGRASGWRQLRPCIPVGPSTI